MSGDKKNKFRQGIGPLKLEATAFRKVSINPADRSESDPSGAVAAIVKVARADYVPSGVSIRKRISPNIFTADILLGGLAALEEDPDIISISLPEKLRTFSDK